MKSFKQKIDINDLRADKGGDPDIYRRALLSTHGCSPSASSPHPTPLSSPLPLPLSSSTNEDGDTCCPTSLPSPQSSASGKIEEALSLDTQRRSTLTRLENLRSQLSTLQKNVIAPKKKAKEDVTSEVEKLKSWKVEIARLSKDVKDLKRRRDECLDKINALLLGVVDNKVIRNVDGCLCGQQSNDKAEEQPSRPTKQPLPPGAALSTAAAIATTATSAPPLKTSISLPLLSPTRIKSTPPERILNLNVGVLGHVDTGKTSLVKTLSSVLSTAALDKSKQSRARGITLDLGFSAFLLPLPEHLRHSDGAHFYDGGREDDAEDNSNQATDTNRNNPAKPQKSKEDNTTIKLPPNQKYELLQVTLVDCPGHASLIRTIIGGAQIIDMVLLVVDATKGMQTQTAECLVIAEMTTRNLIVVLNKIDMFTENEREGRLKEAERKMRIALRGTKFEEAQIVGISACVGGEKFVRTGGATSKGLGNGANNNTSSSTSISGTNNIHRLLSILQSQMRLPHRDLLPSPDRFHFAVDHCFPIKGQGTVLTGTCLSGSCTPNDVIEFPTLATQKKVKGLQTFRRRADIVRQGDRAGICVSNFDAKLMERGIVASPGTVKLIRGAIAVVRKVRFFKGRLVSGSKFHVSVGHTTVMATVTFWGAREISQGQVLAKEKANRWEEKSEPESNNTLSFGGSSNNQFGQSSLGGSADLAGLPRLKFDWNQDFLHQDVYLEVLPSPSESKHFEWHEQPEQEGEDCDGSSCSTNSLLQPLHWARLEFLTPVYCPMDSLVIGSRLDSEMNVNACRLAFSGRLVERYDAKTDHSRLKSYVRKEKKGTVCRLGDPYRRSDDNHIIRYEVFGTNLFKKETNMVQFVGLLVETDYAGDVGIIQSSFGNSGKFRVNFPAGTKVREGDALYLRFKRYANDPKKAIHQDGSLPTARAGSRVDLPAKKKKNKSVGKKIVSVPHSSSKATMSAEENNNDNQLFRDGFTQNNTRRTNSAAIGEIVTLKGDLLENGKHSVAIVLGLFSMEDDIRQYKGRKVVALPIITDKYDTKEIRAKEGIITGPFGKMGKCKVVFQEGIGPEAVGSRVKILGRY